MKSILTLPMASLVLASTPAPPFAVKCIGSSNSESTISGRLHTNSTDLGNQVYVIDPAKETVHRALFPRREFDPVCAIDGDNTFSSVSPGLIVASSFNDLKADPHNTCEFELDRMSGKGSQVMRMEWKDGRFHQLEWLFTCEKTETPVFDLNDRKF